MTIGADRLGNASDTGAANVRESITLDKFEGDPADGILVESVTIHPDLSVTVRRGDEIESYPDAESYKAAREAAERAAD